MITSLGGVYEDGVVALYVFYFRPGAEAAVSWWRVG